MLYCIVITILLIVTILLTVKIFTLKLAAREIGEGFEDRLKSDTNLPVFTSSRDKDMSRLAGDINRQLELLRTEHKRYIRGDMELKNAITNISHDIRTPLTAVCGYIDMLEKTDNEEDRARYISIMKDRTQFMKQLTDELFRYSIIAADGDELDTENVFVNQVLAESISSFYPALTEKGIQPEIHLTERRIERQLNKAALSRVFSNLLGNAVKYSSGDLIITLSDTGDIVFSNSAPGLSTVETEQLFDRFYTVETAHHSTGLGLSIARTFIERMGCSITAEHSDGRLTITLVL
ncbi:MAG: HAMP domain-containing histidine kinase [Ruminococcus sp.]|nr:HAMP domain-containing histidine kinase [Ruminococcus sp.]